MTSPKRISLIKYSAVVLSCITATVLKAAETPPTSLLALSKGEQSLSIVDPATLTVVARVPAGPDPHEVIASDDGKFAFISNYGGGSYNTITVVDLLAQKTLPIIDLGALRGPHGLAFVGGGVDDPDGPLGRTKNTRAVSHAAVDDPTAVRDSGKSHTGSQSGHADDRDPNSQLQPTALGTR